ncbi:MAG: glycosyltransferase family 2 protein [Methylococcaceae bacterium]|nr:glycosyltransferase family 2 protein [Methylococcaceae bacterium]
MFTLNASELLFLFFGLLVAALISYDFSELLDVYRLQRRAKTAEADAGQGGVNEESEFVPKIDIVIPVFNMGDTLERTLESIEKSDYSNKSIIVVDDGSDDEKTRAILKNNAGRVDRVERIAHGGKTAAVNHGAALGDGDIIVFLDADSYVTPDFIQSILSELKPPVDAVDFVIQVANPEESYWTRMARFEREILSLKPDNFGALFVIRRSSFESGPFVDCLSPQFEINYRLAKAGKLKIGTCKIVFSDEPTALTKVYRRKRRWVYGLLESLHLHGLAPDYHILVPFLDVLILMMLLMAPAYPAMVGFPIALLLVWTVKSVLIARLLGLPVRDGMSYVPYMIVLCLAVIEATLRFRMGRKVKWR